MHAISIEINLGDRSCCKMVNDLLPVFRSLRSSFIAGVLILICFYLFFEEYIRGVEVPEALNDVFSLNEHVKIALLALTAILIGSLYTTALEGIVDWMHRKRVASPLSKSSCSLVAKLQSVSAPFSVSSFERIRNEVGRLYAMHKSHAGDCNGSLKGIEESSFLTKNLVEILWMEGKLVGTSLKDAYDKYRAEGENLLSTAILLPFVCLSICYVFNLDFLTATIIFAIVVTVSHKLFDNGLYYYRRANSFLAHHIADGKILTPTMEDLLKSCRHRVAKLKSAKGA